MTDPSDTTETARAFGRYRVLEVLGEGAMGTVYLAEDPVIGRKVAVKVLQPQKGISDLEREEMQSRFEREFKSAGNLTHPHLVTVHDVGREQGVSFIAMEYVEGDTLRTVLNKGARLAFPRIITLLRQIASALDFAHGRGIIHRDVKPANILLTARGDAKIADFGVAKISSVELTRTGIILGTPAYMSPEQVTDQNLTPAADQFSLAVMAYQMLAGRRPFGGENATKTLYQIAYQEPAAASEINREIPAGADAVLKKAMIKKPAARFANCRAFVDALGAALETGDQAVAATESQGHSDLATRRIQQVLPENPNLSHLEMTLPTLELGDAPAPLMDAVPDGGGDSSYLDPPPALSELGPPAMPLSPAPQAIPEAQPPAPASIPPPEPTPAPTLQPLAPRSLPVEGPPPEFAAPKAVSEERLDLLPVAPEVDSPDDIVFGMVEKDPRYRAMQAAGWIVAVIVALLSWIFWAPPS